MALTGNFNVIAHKRMLLYLIGTSCAEIDPAITNWSRRQLPEIVQIASRPSKQSLTKKCSKIVEKTIDTIWTVCNSETTHGKNTKLQTYENKSTTVRCSTCSWRCHIDGAIERLFIKRCWVRQHLVGRWRNVGEIPNDRQPAEHNEQHHWFAHSERAGWDSALQV